jgi:Raf kinase inhibitor-like YbhB/YbcL family protein
MAEFRIWSDEFEANGFLAKDHEFDNPGFGVAGANRSPALYWEAPPPEAKSLALTLYDPDAPTGSGFWHWVVVNIPIDVRGLPQNAGNPAAKLMPAGALQLRNDYGTAGFGGVAPPQGDPPHRYVFRIHALGVEKLDISPDTTNAVARFMTNLNEVDSASVTALYELRKRPSGMYSED